MERHTSATVAFAGERMNAREITEPFLNDVRTAREQAGAMGDPDVIVERVRRWLLEKRS